MEITSYMLVTNCIPQDAIDTTFEKAEKAFGREFNYCVAYIHKRVENGEIIDTERCRIYRPTNPVISYDVCLDFYNILEKDVRKQAELINEIKDDFGRKKYSHIRVLKKDNIPF